MICTYTAAAVLANSAFHQWTDDGEGVFATLFKKTYMKKDFRNISIPYSVPGCGTGNNPQENFNKTVKAVKRKPSSFTKFVHNTVPALCAEIGLDYSGKMKGKEDTKGDRDRIVQTDFLKNRNLYRPWLLVARDLIDNQNMRLIEMKEPGNLVYILNSKRNLSDSENSNNIITRKQAVWFFELIVQGKHLDENDYFTTVEEARDAVSKYHIVRAKANDKLYGGSWRITCSCYDFNRNNVYCSEVIAVVHDIGIKYNDVIIDIEQMCSKIPHKKKSGRPKGYGTALQKNHENGPSAKPENSVGEHVYRESDDKSLGGVGYVHRYKTIEQLWEIKYYPPSESSELVEEDTLLELRNAYDRQDWKKSSSIVQKKSTSLSTSIKAPLVGRFMGSKVRRYFKNYGGVYYGEVREYSKKNKLYEILYDDGEEYFLSESKVASIIYDSDDSDDDNIYYSDDDYERKNNHANNKFKSNCDNEYSSNYDDINENKKDNTYNRYDNNSTKRIINTDHSDNDNEYSNNYDDINENKRDRSGNAYNWNDNNGTQGTMNDNYKYDTIQEENTSRKGTVSARATSNATASRPPPTSSSSGALRTGGQKEPRGKPPSSSSAAFEAGENGRRGKKRPLGAQDAGKKVLSPLRMPHVRTQSERAQDKRAQDNNLTL